MLFSILKKVNFNGTLEIVDSKNKTYTFGKNTPFVRIKLKTKTIEKKLFIERGC